MVKSTNNNAKTSTKKLSFYEALYSDLGESSLDTAADLADYGSMRIEVNKICVDLKKFYPWETSKIKLSKTKINTSKNNYLFLKEITIYKKYALKANLKDTWDLIETYLLNSAHGVSEDMKNLWYEAMQEKKLNIIEYATNDDKTAVVSVTFKFTLTKWNNSWDISDRREPRGSHTIKVGRSVTEEIADQQSEYAAAEIEIGSLKDAIDEDTVKPSADTEEHVAKGKSSIKDKTKNPYLYDEDDETSSIGEQVKDSVEVVEEEEE